MLHDRPEGLDETRRRSSAPPHLRPARRVPRRSETEARLLGYLRRILVQGRALILPETDESSPLGYSYPEVETSAGLAPGTGRAFLEQLAELGYLRREIHGFVLLCPHCAARTVDHVFLERDQRSPCPACAQPFSFEQGTLARIHVYTPARLAFRAVALGRLVTPEERAHVARETPRARPAHAPRLRPLHPWKRWRAA